MIPTLLATLGGARWGGWWPRQAHTHQMVLFERPLVRTRRATATKRTDGRDPRFLTQLGHPRHNERQRLLRVVDNA